MEALERKITTRIRRWLRLPKSLISAALLGNINALKLPRCSITEVFLVSRTRNAHQFRESKDMKLKGATLEAWKIERH